MNAFRKIALITVLATVVLISIGGLVRVTGAGLGCPDWPKCWGCWFPPSSLAEVDMAYVEAKGYDVREFNPVKMWTEYLNRMVGVLIGFLVLGTAIAAFPHRRVHPRIFWCAVFSVVLVAFQGWLGGQVVRSELHPVVVTAHMLLAIVLIGVLLYAVFMAYPAPDAGLPPEAKKTAYWLCMVLFALTVIQTVLGTQVREGIDPFIKDPGGLPRSEWLAKVGPIDYIHRSSSWVVLIAAGWLFREMYRRRITGPISQLSRILLGGVVVQIGLGVVLAYAGLPPPAQVLHLTGASVLICIQIYAILVVRAQPARTTAP